MQRNFHLFRNLQLHANPFLASSPRVHSPRKPTAHKPEHGPARENVGAFILWSASPRHSIVA
jgi:hypothetical protein